MRCPHCGGMDDKVIDSRQNSAGTSIRRRRECISCGYRFTSYEGIEEKPLMVIKRDGRREPFDRTKLERGIRKSLAKRPISQEAIEDLIHSIEDEAQMLARSSHEIESRTIGDMLLKKLYEIDRVGYVRFASVYKMFDNVEEFIKEIEFLSHA